MGLGKLLGNIVKATPWGAVAEVGSSLISGIAGNAAQKSANKANIQIAEQNNQTQRDIAAANNQNQIDMMRENNQFSRDMALEMFNLENEYNSPVEQLKRLQEAGVNPAVYFANQNGSAGTADGATPSAAGSTISPQLPNMVTPTVQAVPPIVTGVLGALTQLANISQTKAQAKKLGVETDKLQKFMDEEFNSLVLNNKNLEIKNNADQFQYQMEQMFAQAERGSRLAKTIQEIYNLGADIQLKAAQGKLAQAQADLAKMEKEFTNSRNTELKYKLPYVVSLMKGQIELLNAQAGESRASASEHYARVELTKQQAERIKEARPVLLEIDKLNRDNLSNNKYEFDQTIGDKIKMVTQQMQLQGKELDRIDALIERAKKENNIFYLQQAIHMLREISDGVSNYIPAKGAAQSPNAGYTIGYGLPDSTW